MRKVIVQLMILLTCMPLLVCAMPVCDLAALVAQKNKAHCIERPLDNQPNSDKIEPIMLIADCGQIDFAPTAVLHEFGTPVFDIDVDGLDCSMPNALATSVAEKQRIRGSPDTLFSLNGLPIYLTTRRIRL